MIDIEAIDRENADLAEPDLLEHVPGQCSDHPGLELVKHRRLRLRWHNYVTDPATCCPSPDHLAADLERCRWCGGPLNVAGAIFRLSPRREYCSDLHRLHAFRARARAAREQIARDSAAVRFARENPRP